MLALWFRRTLSWTVGPRLLSRALDRILVFAILLEFSRQIYRLV